MGKLERRNRTLLLLDRDGTLIEEEGYPSDPARVRLYPGVPQALRKLKKAGFRLAVVSNQSGVGRGLVTLKQMHRVNRRFLELLKKRKAPIDGLYWCPHRPEDGCSCRKPKLGMARRAARDLKVSWKRSISVGDRPSDVEMGRRTGGLGVLVLTGYGKRWNKSSSADHIARNFKEAADWILKRHPGMS
jgi:histidinol-phosphate phosphatase family protein